MIEISVELKIDEDETELCKVIECINAIEGVSAKEIDGTYFEYNDESDPWWDNECNKHALIKETEK